MRIVRLGDRQRGAIERIGIGRIGRRCSSLVRGFRWRRCDGFEQPSRLPTVNIARARKRFRMSMVSFLVVTSACRERSGFDESHPKGRRNDGSF